MPSSAVTVEAEGNTLEEAIYTGSQYYRNDTYIYEVSDDDTSNGSYNE